MPISYILWVHSQTYNRMIIQSQIEETMSLSQYRRKDKHETVVPLSAFDLSSAYETSQAHHSGRLDSKDGNSLAKIIEEEEKDEVMTLNSHQTVEESIRFGQLNDANYKILRGGGSQMLSPDKFRFAKLAQMGDPDIDEE